MSRAAYTLDPPIRAESHPVPPRRAALERSAMGLFDLGERVFAVVGLIVFSGAVIPHLQDGGAGSAGNSVAELVFRSLYLCTAVLFLLRPVTTVRTALQHKPTPLLLGLALLSVTWSVVPEETIRYGFRLTMVSLFGVYLASRFSLAELLRLLGWTFGVTAVLSAATAVLLPAYGISGPPHPGAWQGVYTHKNLLGLMMSLGAGTFALLATGEVRRRWLAWSGFALCCAMVLLSRSTSSLVVLATILVLFPMLRALPRHAGKLILCAICGVLLAATAAIVFVAFAEPLLALLGKDATLTGRTDLWAALLHMVERRPWVGYGYHAFWSHERSAAEIWSAVGWMVEDAHNGYLALMLHLGLLGLVVFLAGFVVAVRRAMVVLWDTRSSAGLWPLLFLSVVLLQNLTESTIMTALSTWVLYVTIACAVGEHARRAAAARHQPQGRSRTRENGEAWA